MAASGYTLHSESSAADTVLETANVKIVSHGPEVAAVEVIGVVAGAAKEYRSLTSTLTLTLT